MGFGVYVVIFDSSFSGGGYCICFLDEEIGLRMLRYLFKVMVLGFRFLCGRSLGRFLFIILYFVCIGSVGFFWGY